LGDGITPDKIAPGVVIHAGCKILGSLTSIGRGSEIGAEAPATLENCQLGEGVSLRGGYFSGATFLDKAAMGSGAHVRSGTLLEEEASCAHTVGLKQTIFFPFVTAGSLINFCDCLMAGGTGRGNHSEIGSSYVHFNFTPRQDKATASLIGEVPHGVMLDRAPIFLGGQGGLVGPARIAYGTVIPAGSICREDVLSENRLFVPPAPASGDRRKHSPRVYGSIDRIVTNNLIFIGNIEALKAWYILVRKRWMSGDPFSRACWVGAVSQLEACLDERITRLGELAQKMPESLGIGRLEGSLPLSACMEQEKFIEEWPKMERRLREGPPENAAAGERDAFLSKWEEIGRETPYHEAVALLGRETRATGTAWLQAVVDSVAALWKGVQS